MHITVGFGKEKKNKKTEQKKKTKTKKPHKKSKTKPKKTPCSSNLTVFNPERLYGSSMYDYPCSLLFLYSLKV